MAWHTSQRFTALRTVPTNSKVFFPAYEYAGKVLLKSKTKIGGNHAFFKDN